MRIHRPHDREAEFGYLLALLFVLVACFITCPPDAAPVSVSTEANTQVVLPTHVTPETSDEVAEHLSQIAGVYVFALFP